MIDDRDATIKTDPDAHRRRWAAWLWWGNILQLLTRGGGDGLQLAYSDLAAFDPIELAAAEGTVLRGYASDAIDPDTATWLDLPPDTPPTSTDPVADDPAWDEVIDLIDPEESALEALVRGLIERSAPLPAVGLELGLDAWQAELAWPNQRIAVVLAADPDDEAARHEALRRDKAFEAAGWRVATAKDWDIDQLTDQLAKGNA